MKKKHWIYAVCIVGILALILPIFGPFLLSLILSLIVSCMRLVFPIGVIVLIKKFLDKKKKASAKKTGNTGMPRRSNPANKATDRTKNVPKEDKQKAAERKAVDDWYEVNGKDKIVQLIERAKKIEGGRPEVWIRANGICTCKKKDGRIQRIGNLRYYPSDMVGLVAKKIRKETGYDTRLRPGFLCISWKVAEV